MQKILSNGKSVASPTHQRTVGLAMRAFASSPQPNPFDKSIKTSLEHAGAKHNFYKLPALADSRICKFTEDGSFCDSFLLGSVPNLCSLAVQLNSHTRFACFWRAPSATATISA